MIVGCRSPSSQHLLKVWAGPQQLGSPLGPRLRSQQRLYVYLYNSTRQYSPYKTYADYCWVLFSGVHVLVIPARRQAVRIHSLVDAARAHRRGDTPRPRLRPHTTPSR